MDTDSEDDDDAEAYDSDENASFASVDDLDGKPHLSHASSSQLKTMQMRVKTTYENYQNSLKRTQISTSTSKKTTRNS